MEFLNTKQKIIIVIICSTIIILIGIYIIQKSNNKYSYIIEESEENTFAEMEKIDEKEAETIMLHIAGEVEEEGVITVESGARVIDAIEEAGGLTENADISNVNLAYELQDGQKIYIPKLGEEANNIIENNTTVYGKTELVNINTATQTELETVTGIGPSTALKIIKYREENGRFNSIDEIKNVSGIGEAKYESIKEQICVK